MTRWTVLAVFALVVGCQAFDRRVIFNPGQNEVLRVVNGDRFYFDLEENTTTGYQWVYTCDDSDVEVTIDHQPPSVSSPGDPALCGAPGKAEVQIRIHRGFDGPAVVYFKYKRDWEREPAREFKISLFRRTGDVAFWK